MQNLIVEIVLDILCSGVGNVVPFVCYTVHSILHKKMSPGM